MTDLKRLFPDALAEECAAAFRDASGRAEPRHSTEEIREDAERKARDDYERARFVLQAAE